MDAREAFLVIRYSDTQLNRSLSVFHGHGAGAGSLRSICAICKSLHFRTHQVQDPFRLRQLQTHVNAVVQQLRYSSFIKVKAALDDDDFSSDCGVWRFVKRDIPERIDPTFRKRDKAIDRLAVVGVQGDAAFYRPLRPSNGQVKFGRKSDNAIETFISIPPPGKLFAIYCVPHLHPCDRYRANNRSDRTDRLRPSCSRRAVRRREMDKPTHQNSADERC